MGNLVRICSSKHTMSTPRSLALASLLFASASAFSTGAFRHTGAGGLNSLHPRPAPPPSRLRMRSGDPRVVVTGLGVVSAVGSGETFWKNLLDGVSGIDKVTRFDASKFPT